jgi:anti-sigma factor RsiW
MAGTQELLCSETRPLLAKLLDGDLASDERARVERHLAACPICLEQHKAAERAFQALRALPREEHVRLRDEALRELGLDEPPRSRWSRLWRILAFMIVFALAYFYLRERRNVVPEGPRGAETR